MTGIENLVVEYLVSINSKNIFNTCTTVEAFNNLLCSNSKIKIQENKINYTNLEINYKIQLTKKDKIKFFHMTFKCSEVDKLKLYEEFLRGVKSVVGKISDNGVIVLWDDIGVYYCKKSYPLINKVENTMRKLLTKFMMINIGEDWDKTVISDEIKRSIAKKDETIKSKSNDNARSYDYLYQTDFITLSDFLFKEYPNKTYENFNKEVKKSKDISKFKIEDIIKKSNWDRYFSRIVECEGEFLNTRWKKLYDLRCKVAHNNQLNRTEYEMIVALVDEITPKLEGVIKKLDEVKVDDDFKFRIIENMLENIYPDSKYFLSQYKTLEEILNLKCLSMNLEDKSVMKMVKILFNNEIIEDETFTNLKKVIDFRNRLVHEMDLENSEKEIAEMLEVLIECQEKLLLE